MQTDVIFLSVYVPEKEFAEDYTVDHEVTDITLEKLQQHLLFSPNSVPSGETCEKLETLICSQVESQQHTVCRVIRFHYFVGMIHMTSLQWEYQVTCEF